MRVLLLLSAMVAMALPFTGADSDYAVTSTSTESVESSTNHVNYVKQWTLTSTNNDDDDDDGDDDDDSSDNGDDKIDSLKLQLSGRVFVSYVSGLPTGVLGYVNVSGDSEGIVNMVAVDPDDDDDDLHVRFNGRNGSTTDGYLLTEIFLATSNIVTDVEIESSAEVVFEDNVLVSSNTNEELQLKASDASVVFVSAASTAMALQDLKLELSDSASLQFSVDSITVREDAQLQAHDASTITVLTSTFTVDDLDLDAENSGTICISAEDLTAGSYDGEAASKISLPNASSKYSSTGSLDCAEVSVPAREPKCVSNGCSDSSNDSTTAPTPTTSTTSETNTPASTTASPEGATTSDQASAVGPLYTSHAFAISLAAGLLVTAWL